MQSFEEINLLEMGFGTGLNALLTAEIAALNYHKVNYTGLEAFPVSSEMVKQLDNSQQELHKLEWNKNHKLNDFFTFRKIETRVQAFTSDTLFNLVYYDAFAPESQPELWTEDLFTQIASLMAEGGVLTTYCSKGYVQRNLKAAGFCVEKHPGPARKREVLRAIRS
jgi:tRNA U34 5-methylaminomethyl-2-thiouridine-forming methyltransferase MnmC